MTYGIFCQNLESKIFCFYQLVYSIPNKIIKNIKYTDSIDFQNHDRVEFYCTNQFDIKNCNRIDKIIFYCGLSNEKFSAENELLIKVYFNNNYSTTEEISKIKDILEVPKKLAMYEWAEIKKQLFKVKDEIMRKNPNIDKNSFCWVMNQEFYDRLISLMNDWNPLYMCFETHSGDKKLFGYKIIIREGESVNMITTDMITTKEASLTINPTKLIYDGADYGNFFLTGITEMKLTSCCPDVKDVIFNAPATIVFWEDGSKTVVKAQDGDPYDEEKGLAMAYVKKCLGNKGNFNNFFKKWLKK